MNVDMEDNRARLPRYFTLEMLMSVMVALSGLVLIWNLVSPVVSVLALFIAGIVFTLSITVLIRLLMDPDSVRARQSSNVLQLASQTLEAMGEEGLDSKSAQRICSLLLPSTAAIAVAITDDRFILGYAGYEESHNLSGSVIRTHATYSTLADGKTRVLFTPEEIGFPKGTHGINAAIIVPLTVGKDVKGTLKFYYRRAGHISETQKSIATGFGQLLSTQMAASALEEQTALATKMELKMLQSQINPHFLFNTLNTLKWIATLNHVTPVSHGIDALSSLLQSTLIKKDELIPFDDELRNLKNYCDIQQLRYAGRFEMEYQIEDAAGYWTVPRFILQPLVENSILHGTADEDDFVTITVRATVSENLLTIHISDTGCGFDPSAIKEKNSERFSGIGLSNVDERMRLHYGNEYGLTIESAPGIGTQCILRIPNEAIR